MCSSGWAYLNLHENRYHISYLCQLLVMPRQNVWMLKCTFLVTYGIFIIWGCVNDCHQCSSQVVIVNSALIDVLFDNVIDEVLNGDSVVLSNKLDVPVTARGHV